MTILDLGKMSVEELVGRFSEIGAAQDQALQYEELKKFKQLYREMDKVDNELRQRGIGARLALQKLYTHQNMQVRLKAAVRTLGVAPIEARKIIEEIAQSKNYPQAGDAGMTLYNLDRGVFVPT